MRHVPGFDQGWRSHDDKKQRRGHNPGSSIENVEDHRQKTKKEHSAMRWLVFFPYPPVDWIFGSSLPLPAGVYLFHL